jgi:16S rRNA (uracil1498-N3)-methyltransferase
VGGIFLFRFFAARENIKDEEVILCGDNAAHANVLRLRCGEEIIVVPLNASNESVGCFDYHCVVTQTSRDEVRVRIVDKLLNQAELPLHVTLFQALPKGDKMSDIIEHMTELGVSEIIPVITSRCVSKPTEKFEQKVMRWHKIAESAAKLSHRGRIPKIGSVVPLLQGINMAEDYDLAFVCYESEKDNHIIPFLSLGLKPHVGTRLAAKPLLARPLTKLAFFIGPEGGFSPEEIAYFKKHGISVLSLGRGILRTQSAAALVMSYINFCLHGGLQ